MLIQHIMKVHLLVKNMDITKDIMMVIMKEMKMVSLMAIRMVLKKE